MSKCITVGSLVRRRVRRFLLDNEIDFVEEKGWLNSVFYLKCTDEVFRQISKVLVTAFK